MIQFLYDVFWMYYDLSCESQPPTSDIAFAAARNINSIICLLDPEQ